MAVLRSGKRRREASIPLALLKGLRRIGARKLEFRNKMFVGGSPEFGCLSALRPAADGWGRKLLRSRMYPGESMAAKTVDPQGTRDKRAPRRKRPLNTVARPAEHGLSYAHLYAINL
jgi:hypothetical protein